MPHGAVDELSELQHRLRQVLRGLWSRRRPPAELAELVHGDPSLGRRHVAALAHVARTEGETVGGLARALGFSLPAASKLTTELESHGLVRRREDPADRRRTVVELDEATAKPVRAWLDRRDRPLRAALDALTPDERAAFLKGLGALADALMEESSCGSVRPHHRAPHRRRSHRHRPL
jgi:DNA-binding MarR family transcriptional regulator